MPKHLLKISDDAYSNLASRVAHTSRRQATIEYTGWSIETVQAQRSLSSNGLGKYLDNFAKKFMHPRTFQDTRPERMQAHTYPKVPQTIAYKQGIPLDGSKMEHFTFPPMNWLEIRPLDLTAISFTEYTPMHVMNAIHHIDGPTSVLISPYSLDDWGDWTYYYNTAEEMRPRNITLAKATVIYLDIAAMWWRIPSISVYSMTRQYNNPTARVAAVLEAIGLGYLSHTELIYEDVRTKRAEYMRKYRANYQGPNTERREYDPTF